MTHIHANVDWKGQWVNEIGPTTMYNTPTPPALEQLANNVFRALPLKHYRRELPGTNTNQCSNAVLYHNPGRLTDINRPGGMVTNSASTQFRQDTVALVIPPSDACGLGEGQCMSSQSNARKRVRSSGMMTQPKNSQSGNQYFVTGNQYLYSRNKTAVQNTIIQLRHGDSTLSPGQPGSQHNVYSSGTTSTACANGEIIEYPVYYKPNNYKYAQQGAVTSSDRIYRIKYDTITYGGQAVNTPYGLLKPSSLAYAVNGDTYRLKDKIGTQAPCVPTVLSYQGANMRTC